MKSEHLVGITLWRLPLSVLGGLLSSLAMPRENIWPLIFVSVAFLLVTVRGLRFFSSFFVGFAGGLAFYLSQIEWMSLYLGPVPWLALSTLEAIIFGLGMALIAMLWRWLDQFSPSLWKSTYISLAIATIWTAREWVAINLPYGGFPWSRVAQALSDSFLSGLVFFVGISGLTFLAVFITTAVLQLVTSWRASLRLNAISTGLVAFTLIVPLVHSIPTSAESGEISVAAVQGNANAGLFANADRGTFLRNHLDATALLLDHPMRDELDLIVWPENASDINPQQSELAKLQLQSVITEFQVPLVIGAITEAGGEVFNSSLYYNVLGEQVDQYDKKRPVPFAEYVPDRDFWYQLAPDLIGLVSRGYAFGTRDGIFEFEDNQLGVLICFEIAIDDIGRELVSDGAEIILSQTNNADFGRSDETFQQAALARLRAIETGRAIVNISTVGVSVIYLPDGSIVSELPIFTPGVLVERLPLRSSKTPAMMLGGAFDLAINFAALALMAWSINHRLQRRSRSHSK